MRRLTLSWSFPVLALAGSALILPGCGRTDSGSSAPAGGGAAPAAGGGGAKQTLKVGTEATFPPFESINEQGEFVGFDIDLVKAIGEKAGFEVQFQNLGFDALIPALASGQIDIAAAGMSITEERKQSVDFSDPYVDAGLVIAVRQNETAITGKDTLKGKVVAVQRGSTGAEAADKLKAEGGVADVKYFANVPLAMMELTKGGVDAVINDKPTSEVYVAKQPGQVKLLSEELESDSYGLAIRKGNTELLTKVNAALKQLQEDGTMERLRQTHFVQSETEGTDAPAAPTEAAAPATQPAQ